MAQVFEIVREILVDKLGVDKEEVTRNARIIDDLGADDLDCVELIMHCEAEFRINIPIDLDKQELGTVGQLVDLIELQLSPTVHSEGFL